MTLRGLARGSVLYSIGFVLPRIGSFLLLPLYVTVLSTDDFGAIALVVSVAQLTANVLRMGMDGALMRMHFDSAEPDGQNRLIATVTTLTGVVAAAGALIAAGLAYAFFSILFVDLPFLPFGAMAAILSFTITFQYLPATIFRAREEPVRFFAFTGGAFIVTAIVTVVLLLVIRIGVTGALLGQLAGGIFVVGVSLVMLIRAGGPSIDRSLATEALRFGLPLVPHTLSGWMLNVSDRWLLSFLLPLSTTAARSAIGVYALGYQLAYAIDLLAQSFNAAWVPFFYRHGSSRMGPRIHREMTTLVVAGFGAIAAILALNASLVVAVIARPDFAAAASLIPILAIAFLAHAFYFAVVTVIFFQRRTGVLPVITASSAVVNVAANVVLIPVIGVMGAAWATLVSFTLMAAVTFLVARRTYQLDLDWPRLGLLFGAAVAAATFAAVRNDTLSVPRIALDGLASLFAVGLAFTVSVGPIATLRSLTREAADEDPASAP